MAKHFQTKLIFIFFLVLGTCGCSVSHSGLLQSQDGVHPPGPLFLGGVENQQKRLKQFLETKTAWTERDKIVYLLSSIQDSDAVFIRNRNQYDGKTTAKWLRWKMNHRQFRKDPILTAGDFVNRVAAHSNRTGIPYEIVLSDGRREKANVILAHELIALESALHRKPLQPSVVR